VYFLILAVTKTDNMTYVNGTYTALVTGLIDDVSITVQEDNLRILVFGSSFSRAGI
jgi:hypothetical protein